MSYQNYLNYLNQLSISDNDKYVFYTKSYVNFLIYDQSHNLIYSKHNFNFDYFINTIPIPASFTNKNKYVRYFQYFLHLHDWSYNQKYTIKPEYVKYFTPITSDIISYLNNFGNYSKESGILYYHDPNDKVQDFFNTTGDKFMAYNKFTFNFNKFMLDFNIYGSKLLLFNDFISRNYYSPSPSFFIVYDDLRPYFKEITQDIIDYISSQAVFSNLKISDKSIYTIDYEKFIVNNPILISQLKNKYTDFNQNTNKYIDDYIRSDGQFEFLDISYVKNVKPIDQLKTNVCTVYIKTPEISPSMCGFLYNEEDTYYVITSSKLINKYPSVEKLYCLFENDTENQLVEFRIIGFDVVSNILMGIYDKLSPHNIMFNSNLSNQKLIQIDRTKINNEGSDVYVIGNLGLEDSSTTIKASVMKTNYGGGFSIKNSIEIVPESIMLNSYFYNTIIGSPIYYSNNINDTNESITIIGIVTENFTKNSQGNYMLGLNNKLLYLIIKSILSKWNHVLSNYDNIEQISNNQIDSYIRNGFPKAWLGIDAMYYHYDAKFVYSEMTNFPYIGGLIVKNIILGYNTITNMLVYDGSKLNAKESIRLFSPLEDTLIHKRITNSGVPIIIKYITFYNLITNEVSKHYLGKFGSQKNYSEYVYGHQYYESISLDGYTNIYKYLFNPVQINYYYYNGIIWINETINIGSDNDDFYVNYKNEVCSYLQNKFEYPEILYKYQKVYDINV